MPKGLSPETAWHWQYAHIFRASDRKSRTANRQEIGRRKQVLQLDFSKVIDGRNARATRKGKPFSIFYSAAQQCVDAGKEIVRDGIEFDHNVLLERSVVITFATHVEVYFRDILDAIFRHCDPEFFVPKLKHIHGVKYDIENLIEIHKKSIHPLELVSSETSFQNTAKIEKVFSKFVGKSLWATVFEIKLRVADEPDTAVGFDAALLASLNRVFELRHVLVHNPKATSHLNSQVVDDLDNSIGLMLAVDVVLTDVLHKHRDPSLGNEDHPENTHS